jgi:hypothetical protein
MRSGSTGLKSSDPDAPNIRRNLYFIRKEADPDNAIDFQLLTVSTLQIKIQPGEY